MNRKSISFFFLGVMTGVLVASAGFSWVQRRSLSNLPATKVLKLAHTLDPKHPVHQAMVFMSDRLREKSNGSMQLEIYPNGQLGSEQECIELLQQGALDIAKTSAAPLEGFIPELAIFGVPYIFRDEDHYWRLIQGELGQQLLSAGETKGIRGLCYYDAGARSFYTVNKPILAPSDLKGLKIRVQQSKTAMDMVETLGGSPTPVPFGELYTALQSRMVDGAENNAPSLHSSRHYEVCKHYSLDEHTRVPDLLLISSLVWEQLSPAARTWLQQSADESSEFQRKLWREETDRLLELLEKEGVAIHRPNLAPFAEEVKRMHENLNGTVVGDLLKKIQEL